MTGFPLLQGRGWWEPKGLLSEQSEMKGPTRYEGFLLLFIRVKVWLRKQKLLSARQTTLFLLLKDSRRKTISILIIFTSIKIDQTSDLHRIGLLCVPCYTHSLTKTHRLREERD